MSYFETVHTEQYEGFTIKLAFGEEDHDWRDDFDPGCCDHEEIKRNLNSGKWMFFVARVEASQEGIVLGTDYLGSCMYEGVADFTQEGGYWPDMRDTAIAEAKAVLEKLKA
jgi:hypothetical protein